MYLCIDTHEGFDHSEATAKLCIDTPGVSIDTHQQVSIHTHLYRYIWGFHAKLSYCQALYRYLGTQYRYIWGFMHSIDTHVLGIDTCLENSSCHWLKHILMICLSTFKDLFQFKTKYKVKYQFNLSLLVISKLNSRLTISPFLI